MPLLLKRCTEYLRMWVGLGYLGLICALWTSLAMLLQPLLPTAFGRRLGRRAIHLGFRSYIGWLGLIGACRFDLSELDELRDAGPLVLAPNHPCLLDAVMVISRLPDVACVMKAALMRNWFLGGGARLARYIRNDSPLSMAHAAVDNLRAGSLLLMFPEGTRTTAWPLNPCKGSVGLIAGRARVPVQTLLIETDSLYLSKGWPLFRRPDQPIHYRIRLGHRFEPPSNVAAFNQELEAYFRSVLPAGAPARPERDLPHPLPATHTETP